MLETNVLVLNRSYMPIHVTSARRAFSLIYQDVAHAVAGEYETFDFDAWRRLRPRDGQDAIGTPSGSIRVPRVILLRYYDRIPKRHIRYSRVNVLTRDKYTCQYCNARPSRSQLNLDHVIPRSLGGRTSWENVVACCVDCNRRKGGRTPHQAMVRLNRKPERPRWTPLVNLASATARYEEWQPFLSIVGGGPRVNTAIS